MNDKLAAWLSSQEHAVSDPKEDLALARIANLQRAQLGDAASAANTLERAIAIDTLRRRDDVHDSCATDTSSPALQRCDTLLEKIVASYAGRRDKGSASTSTSWVKPTKASARTPTRSSTTTPRSRRPHQRADLARPRPDVPTHASTTRARTEDLPRVAPATARARMGITKGECTSGSRDLVRQARQAQSQEHARARVAEGNATPKPKPPRPVLIPLASTTRQPRSSPLR